MQKGPGDVSKPRQEVTLSGFNLEKMWPLHQGINNQKHKYSGGRRGAWNGVATSRHLDRSLQCDLVNWMQRGDTPVRTKKEQGWVGLSSCSWEARMETKPRWQKTDRVKLQRAEVMGS